MHTILIWEVLQKLLAKGGPDEALEVAYGGTDFTCTAPTDVALEGEGQQVCERVRKNG